MKHETKICYVEFHARDLAATRAFFEKSFGWDFTDYGPDYMSFADGRIAGGFFRSDKCACYEAGSPMVVLLDQKLEECLARVTSHGGKITRPIFSYPGGRRFHFTEPSGNELSVCAEDAP